MRRTVAALVLLAVCAAGGCDGGGPDPAITGVPSSPDVVAPEPAGTTTLQVAPPLSDCPALAALVPASVSQGMGVDGTVPPPPAGDDAYLVGCALVGPSATEPGLRIGIQINIIRPRVDPYESQPLATWLTSKPAQLAKGTECFDAQAWAGAPNGSRCARDFDDPPQRTVAVAGADRGTAVHVQATAFQLDKAKPVAAGAAHAASDRAAEETYAAIAATL
ncbi:hypothetical protein ACIA8K_25835 [Catenuloplanes sp. NPDC051500]|uniref:hypothetical protein n=1 Tax=Catenuloplanes sp. NPDC051500 TaxID=3363959 RepID=UPI00379B86AF